MLYQSIFFRFFTPLTTRLLVEANKMTSPSTLTAKPTLHSLSRSHTKRTLILATRFLSTSLPSVASLEEASLRLLLTTRSLWVILLPSHLELFRKLAPCTAWNKGTFYYHLASCFKQRQLWLPIIRIWDSSEFVLTFYYHFFFSKCAQSTVSCSWSTRWGLDHTVPLYYFSFSYHGHVALAMDCFMYDYSYNTNLGLSQDSQADIELDH